MGVTNMSIIKLILMIFALSVYVTTAFGSDNAYSDLVAWNNGNDINIPEPPTPVCYEAYDSSGRLVSGCPENQKAIPCYQAYDTNGNLIPCSEQYKASEQTSEQQKNIGKSLKYLYPKNPKLSFFSEGALEGLLKDAKINHGVEISSTYRNSQSQANAMFKNLEWRRNNYTTKQGLSWNESIRRAVADEKRLYGDKGDAVIDIYSKMRKTTASNKVKTAMKTKIDDFIKQNEYVSNHLKNQNNVNTFDIPSSSFTKAEGERFIKIVEAAMKKSGSKIVAFYHPPDDRAYHIEISQK